MKEDIITLHPRDIGKTLPMTAGRAFAWLYLGQDTKQRQNITWVLGKEKRSFIGNLLQELAHQEKQPFLDFIAELGTHQKNRLHWWASNIAYKNPLACDFFLLWCYAAIFEKVCLGGQWGGEKLLVVFVQDRWLYRYLWQRYAEDAPGLRFLSRKWVLLETLKFAIRLVAVRGYFFLRAIKYLWQSRRAAFRDDRTSKIRDDEKRIYLYSWIQDRFFSESGGFQDAYFGRLPEILARNGFKVTYITPLFSSSALKRKCLDYGEYEFIFLDYYVSFGDILKSLFAIFRISYSKRQNWLRILLQRQQVHEVFFQDHIMYYFAFRRWLKENSQQKITIIYPFENQPWEKMLAIAASESDEKIRLVGYQHGTVPSLFLSYFPGAGESSIMPLPDCIVTNSEYTLNLLKNAGYGETELVNGGALRYEHLHEVGRGSTRQERKLQTALLALPYSPRLAEEMLLAMFDAFEDLEEEKVRFVMKFHPGVPLEHLEIQLPHWPAHFQIIDKPTSEILKEVDLVIYSSSTVGLEALLNDIPVVRYCSEHILDLSPLDTFDERTVRSCSGDNFKQVVLSALEEGSNYLAQQPTLGTGSLNEFFSPINEDAWRRIT